jgi:flavin reductase (DIM6/NTAB) family NADH-FMN oxidoreductase RutF
MFYAAETRDHGLPHDPFKAIVAPRPIGWIGSKGRDGSFNLSPYSFFTVVSDRPKIIMFSSSGRKDSLKNAEETGVFTASLVSAPLLEQMNASSVAVPYGTDEFAIAGLTPILGRMVDAPYVGEAFAALECRVTEIRQPLDVNGQPSGAWMVFGQVVGIHIDEQIIRDGRIDIAVAAPVTRLGYMDYATTTETYELMRPKAP